MNSQKGMIYLELSNKDKLLFFALILESDDSTFEITEVDEKLYMEKMKKIYNYDENTSEEKLQELEKERVAEVKAFINKLRKEMNEI